jgi:putative two-component system response regulator
MAIIDVYDALTNDRPYKKAFSHEQAVMIIKEGLGTQFDPIINKIFVMHEKDFESVEVEKQYFAVHDRLQPTVKAVANIVGTRGSIDFGHTDRMRKYLEILTEALSKNENYSEEISGWDMELFTLSAQMHDVGKIAIPDHILNKDEELSIQEYDDVKDHVPFGIKIIQQVKENVVDGAMLHHAEVLAGSHHEKWDGTGYPLGLKGAKIPLQGRIMAIVDVYDALTSERPQREKKTHAEAVDIIREGSGTQFEPAIVDVFLACEKDFEKVVNT